MGMNDRLALALALSLVAPMLVQPADASRSRQAAKLDLGRYVERAQQLPPDGRELFQKILAHLAQPGAASDRALFGLVAATEWIGFAPAKRYQHQLLLTDIARDYLAHARTDAQKRIAVQLAAGSVRTNGSTPLLEEALKGFGQTQTISLRGRRDQLAEDAFHSVVFEHDYPARPLSRGEEGVIISRSLFDAEGQLVHLQIERTNASPALVDRYRFNMNKRLGQKKIDLESRGGYIWVTNPTVYYVAVKSLDSGDGIHPYDGWLIAR